jgi:hypothetical protein
MTSYTDNNHIVDITAHSHTKAGMDAQVKELINDQINDRSGDLHASMAMQGGHS